MSDHQSQTLEQLLHQHVSAFVESDKPKEIIEKHVEKMFESVVEDAFRSYGDMGKQVKEAIKAAMPGNISDMMGLARYNNLIANAMRNTWESSGIAENVATTLDLVRQALGVPPEPHQGMPERILEAAEKIKGERDQLAAPSRDLVAHMHRQMAFSREAFGPGSRHQGVIDHIRKELREIEASPEDLEEWIDVVLLALDGAWRAGHSPEQVAAGLDAKLTKNEQRKWPDWRTADRTKAIEHDRTGEGREGCTACNSQPGQYHAPECPAVDAFTAGRIPTGPGASSTACDDQFAADPDSAAGGGA